MSAAAQLARQMTSFLVDGGTLQFSATLDQIYAAETIRMVEIIFLYKRRLKTTVDNSNQVELPLSVEARAP